MPTVTPTYKTVQDLLKDEKFSIDDYQREYKWEKKQIDELVNDLTSKFFADYKPEHPQSETRRISRGQNGSGTNRPRTVCCSLCQWWYHA